MNREQLIGLIQSDAKFIDERDDIAEYIRSLPLGERAWTKKKSAPVTSASRPRRTPANSPPSPTKHGLERRAASLRGRMLRRRMIRRRTPERAHGPAGTWAGRRAPRPNWR
jgi:type I restriction enzyme R subunit